MKNLAQQLRKLAEDLRKQSALQLKPTATPNPTASRANNDLGSFGETSTGGAKNKFVPSLPKLPTFNIGESK